MSDAFRPCVVIPTYDNPATVGKWQPRVPEWRATALATWRPRENLAASLGARYSGRQYTQLDNADVHGESYLGFSRFLVFDARLRWSLGHLLQNSIRYTEGGGHILMTASRTDEDYIAIQVVDTGVGISDRDLPHVFERFYRGEPRTQTGRLLDPRGLGQGLFIAREVAEAHGGYLTVRSLQGQGSIFTLVLPTV